MSVVGGGAALPICIERSHRARVPPPGVEE
jgi:hypothetical protein